MDAHTKKKRREQATVEAFLRNQGLPPSCLIDGDRERPDALINIDGRIVGVEVTTVVEASARRPIAAQQWRAESIRIIARAQKIYEEQHPEPLVVNLELHHDWRPGKVDASTLAQELAATVRRAALLLDQPRPFERPGDPITQREPHPALSSLYVNRLSSSPGHWAPTFAGGIFSASAADIRATVEKKEVELDIYRAATPAVWLLIDCDLSGQGITLDVPRPTFDVVTGFERVFCHGFAMAEWVEVPTTSPTTALTSPA
jgi:hypothetical protein